MPVIPLRKEQPPPSEPLRKTVSRIAITDAAQAIEGGMFGSPILTGDGAVGVVCNSGSHTRHKGGGPQPVLAGNLPGWMLREHGVWPRGKKG